MWVVILSPGPSWPVQEVMRAQYAALLGYWRGLGKLRPCIDLMADRTGRLYPVFLCLQGPPHLVAGEMR